MNLASRKRYTPEFKAQAVDLLSTGKPVSQVAEELCISSNGDVWCFAQRCSHGATERRHPPRVLAFDKVPGEVFELLAWLPGYFTARTRR